MPDTAEGHDDSLIYDGSQARCHDPYLRCALYGAAQAALGVTGCCVLAHSPQGCFQLVDAAFGWQDADYTETLTLCTKLCEDEIVHGGEDLLARTILEAAELDVPIMFVLTACGPEIVGDDIVAVCEDMQSRVPFRIVPIQCAGFRGDQNHGTDIALQALLEAL
ncbi:MAG: nitrogenase associated protein, partial [Chloroflexi bacterium]|nr:nitrogenase associated protein [Chloroflexota bacterium]